jgi:hypothetical protein
VRDPNTVVKKLKLHLFTSLWQEMAVVFFFLWTLVLLHSQSAYSPAYLGAQATFPLAGLKYKQQF